MRLRCRLGIHEWDHLGYSVTGSYGYYRHKTWRMCQSCGERNVGGLTVGLPPDVEITNEHTGSFIDHSRPKEIR